MSCLDQLHSAWHPWDLERRAESMKGHERGAAGTRKQQRVKIQPLPSNPEAARLPGHTCATSDSQVSPDVAPLCTGWGLGDLEIPVSGLQLWAASRMSPVGCRNITILTHVVLKKVDTVFNMLESININPFIRACVLSRSVTSDSDLRDCSPPGYSIHGILQARLLECIAISSSRNPLVTPT